MCDTIIAHLKGVSMNGKFLISCCSTADLSEPHFKEREQQMLYDITYMWNLNKYNKLMNIFLKEADSDTKNKSVVINGERDE